LERAINLPDSRQARDNGSSRPKDDCALPSDRVQRELAQTEGYAALVQAREAGDLRGALDITRRLQRQLDDTPFKIELLLCEVELLLLQERDDEAVRRTWLLLNEPQLAAAQRAYTFHRVGDLFRRAGRPERAMSFYESALKLTKVAEQRTQLLGCIQTTEAMLPR